MQSPSTLLGPTDAATLTGLMASNYRKPCWELLALNADGSTAFDLTPYLTEFRADFTDDFAAAQADFVLANPQSLFDPVGGTYAGLLATNRVLQFKKGLTDSAGTKYLLPAFYGRITYTRCACSLATEATIEVTVLDALKLPLRQKITSAAYNNYQVNTIAASLLQRFGKFAPGEIALAPVDRPYAFVQFPDMTIADCMKMLYEPLLYSVRADEAGKITTRPRLGSGTAVLGYPDQTTTPPPDYVIPDSLPLEIIEPKEQDFDGVYNQVRVLGRSAAAQLSLGPNQLLFSTADSSVGAQDRVNQSFDFQQNAGGNVNRVIARNVFVVFHYSTDGNLDTAPRTITLANFINRGAWKVTQSYESGDLVQDGPYYFLPTKPSIGVSPTNTEYWEPLPGDFTFPYYRFTDLYDTDITFFRPKGHLIGFVSLDAVFEDKIVMKIEGRQFSSGGGIDPVRHHGGFDYRFEIYGSPVLSYDKTIVAFADYNPVAVTGEALTDVFGDHATYQAAHQPFAMSSPVEAFLNGFSLGKITADQTILTGETRFNVDYERGRIVLAESSYKVYQPDNAASHLYSTGGVAYTVTTAFSRVGLDQPAPPEVYQSRRDGDSTYTLTGLAVGEGYTLRLHFADPTYTTEGKRIFSIYINGGKAIQGFDIVAEAGGAYKACIKELTGVTPDSTGAITVQVTQHDPLNPSDLLPEAKGLSALICGIEVTFPGAASPYAINCGGSAINPTPPIITANYAYSPVQEAYQINSRTIDNPLISTQADCAMVGGFWANFGQWVRHRQRVSTASLPHVQPGDLIQFYSPKTNQDSSVYVHSVGRTMTVSGGDRDTLDGYLIRVSVRS